MAARPIVFGAAMVRALIEGKKTQTRRVLKIRAIMGDLVSVGPHESLIELEEGEFARGVCHYLSTGSLSGPYAVRFAVGDRLWVKERYAKASPNGVRYEATDDIHDLRQRIGARFMPRWASRLTLIVTEVRVQRLQEISTDDCLAEGIDANDAGLVPVEGGPAMTAKAAYRSLWDDLNAELGYAWDTNPWVVAITFDVHRCNIDDTPEAPR